MSTPASVFASPRRRLSAGLDADALETQAQTRRQRCVRPDDEPASASTEIAWRKGDRPIERLARRNGSRYVEIWVDRWLQGKIFEPVGESIALDRRCVDAKSQRPRVRQSDNRRTVAAERHLREIQRLDGKLGDSAHIRREHRSQLRRHSFPLRGRRCRARRSHCNLPPRRSVRRRRRTPSASQSG